MEFCKYAPPCEFLGVDEKATGKLNEELEELAYDGCKIVLGEHGDLAYENPEKITEVYKYLKDQGKKLKDQCNKEFVYYRMGWLAVAGFLERILKNTPLSNFLSLDEKVDAFMEPLRTDLLYGSGETNSQPWHDQRGSALSFLTISEAFELGVDGISEGKYPTMSGPIDETLFNEKINGLPLTEAMIQVELGKGGKNREEAESAVNQRLRSVKEFIQAPVSPEFADVIRYCADSVGIRERRDMVNELTTNYVERTAEKTGRQINDMLIMSFGCGTALPTLQMMKALKDKTGQAPTVILLDQDPLALAAAQNLAKQMGLEDNVEIHCQRLFNKLGRPLGLEKILNGRKLDIVEDSGLREYLPDSVYKKLTKESWGFLRKGGLMITGNMNKTRPHEDFLHELMGWIPKVTMRTIKRGFDLLGESGVPKDSIVANVVGSGVYTVFAAEKQ